jgi:phosphoribosylformylglycinamidine synthase
VRLAVYAPGAPLEGDVVIVPPALGAAPTSAALDALRAFARGGGRLLALADGVSWLCAAGLLPGAVSVEGPARAVSHVRVEGRATAFTWAIPAGRILGLGPVAAGAHLHARDPEVAALETRGQIVLRYCDAAGGVDRNAARALTVAGLSDESGRVVGLFAPSTPGLEDGLGRQLLACLRGRPARATVHESSPTARRLEETPPDDAPAAAT